MLLTSWRLYVIFHSKVGAMVILAALRFADQDKKGEEAERLEDNDRDSGG